MSTNPIRVLVVDDSVVVRGLIARAIESDSEFKLVGTAMHGEAALAHLRREAADVVVLDVEMPVMDGLATLQKIQVDYPRTRVIMASALTKEGAEITIRALAMGAAGCIAKPVSASVNASVEQLTRELLPLIRGIGRANLNSKTPVAIPPVATPQPRQPLRATPKALVIGSSTGGPQALRTVLTSLPKDFHLPIFIVQHMPAMFTPMLAKHLGSDSGRLSQEARHLEAVQPGTTYVAPGDYHMEITRVDGKLCTRLTEAPAEHFCRPSVNPLFRSAANCYGTAVLAVMLTGMGEDGCDGARTLVEHGGHLLAQDEASSVVWGMPGAVVRAGYAHEVLPLDQIGPRIMSCCLSEVTR